MKKRFKIFELRKKNLKKIHLTKLTKLIQKENNFSILSRLNHILIHEYLLVAVKSKKIFLFILEEKDEVIGYILYAKKEKYLFTEFESMKYKIIKYLIFKIKILSLINIFLAVTKFDMILVNQSVKKIRKNSLNLNLLALKKNFQSKGLGKKLINKTLKILFKKNIKFKYLCCEAPTLRALKFYEKNKFKLVGKKIRISNNLFLLNKKINEF